MKNDRYSERRITRKGGILLFIILLVVAAVVATFSLAFARNDANTDAAVSPSTDITYPDSNGLGQLKDGAWYTYTDKDKIADFRAGQISTDVSAQEVDVSQARGSKANPYVIATADDWEAFVKQAGTTGTNTNGKYYVLAADIDFTGVTFHPVIKFMGTFYGCGYTFKNITCSTWQYWTGSAFAAITSSNTGSICGSYYGTFCVAQNAVIADFNLTGCKFSNCPKSSTAVITGTIRSGFGTICGETVNNSFILNCSTSAEYEDSYNSANSNGDVSGIVSNIDSVGTIYRCSVDFYVNITSAAGTTISYTPVAAGLVTRAHNTTVYAYDNVVFIRASCPSGMDYLACAIGGWSNASPPTANNYIIENFVGYCYAINSNSTRGGALAGGYGSNIKAKNVYVEGRTGSGYLHKYLQAGGGSISPSSNISNTNAVKGSQGYATLVSSTQYTNANSTHSTTSALLSAAQNFFAASNVWDESRITSFWNVTSTASAASAATAHGNVAQSPVRNSELKIVVPTKGTSGGFEHVYDGSKHDLSELADWWSDYEEYIETVEYSSPIADDTDANICIDAGTYSALVTLKGNADTIIFDGQSGSLRTFTYKITIKQAKFNLSGLKWDYDASEPPQYKSTGGIGEAQNITLDPGTIPSGLKVQSYSGTGTNAGFTYNTSVTFDFADDAAARNYILPDRDDPSTYEGTFNEWTKSWTIAKKQVTAVWNRGNTESVGSEYVTVPRLQEQDLPANTVEYKYYSDSALTQEVTLADIRAASNGVEPVTFYVKAALTGTANYELVDGAGTVQSAGVSTSFQVGSYKTVISMELKDPNGVQYTGDPFSAEDVLRITDGAGAVSGFVYQYYHYDASAADGLGAELAVGELPTDAGSYVIVVSLRSGDEADNALLEDSFPFTIQPREVDLSNFAWDYSGTPFEYAFDDGGDPKTYTVSLEYGGLTDLSALGVSVTYTNNEKSAVAGYTAIAKISLTDRTNYIFTGSNANAGTDDGVTYTFRLSWKIEAMRLALPSDTTLTYSGEEIDLLRKAFGTWTFGSGDNYLKYFTASAVLIPDINRPLVTTPSDIIVTNAGRYKITLNVADMNSIKFSDGELFKEIHIDIEKLPITVTGWTPSHEPVFAEGEIESMFYTLIYATDSEGRNPVSSLTVGTHYYRIIRAAEEHADNVTLTGELVHDFIYAVTVPDATPLNLPTFTAGGRTYDFTQEENASKLIIELTYNTQDQTVVINGWSGISSYVTLRDDTGASVTVSADGVFTVNEAGTYAFALNFNPDVNCKWANAGMYNDYAVDFPIEIVVDQMEISAPVLSEMPVYGASEVSLSALLEAAGYEYLDYIVLSGDITATNVGDYTAVITLANDNFRWAKANEAESVSVVLCGRVVSLLADEETVELTWSIVPYALTWQETENGPVIGLPAWAEGVSVAYKFERDGKEYATYEEAVKAGGESDQITVTATLSGAAAGNYGFRDEATGEMTSTSQLTVTHEGGSIWDDIVAFLTQSWLAGLAMWIWLLIFLLVFILLLIIIICIAKHRKKKKNAGQAAAGAPVVNVNAAMQNDLNRLEQERLLREQMRLEREEERRKAAEEREEERRRREQEYQEEKRRREELAAIGMLANAAGNGNNNGGTGGAGGMGMGINGIPVGAGGMAPVGAMQPQPAPQPVAQPAPQPSVVVLSAQTAPTDNADDESKYEQMKNTIREELQKEFGHQARVEQALERIMHSREQDRAVLEEEERAFEGRKRNPDVRRENWSDPYEPQITRAGEEYYPRMSRAGRFPDDRDYRIQELELRLREMEARQWMQYQNASQQFMRQLPQQTQPSYESERVKELENKLRDMEEKQREMLRREEEDRRFREMEERLSAKFASAQQPLQSSAAKPVAEAQPVRPIIVQQPAPQPVAPSQVQPGAVMTTTTTTTIDASKKEKDSGFPEFKNGYISPDNDGKYN